MEKTLIMLDKVLPFVIIFASIGLSISLLGLGIYSWAWLHKRIDLKEIENSKEENRQVLDDANFLKASKKYGPLVQEMIDELAELRNEKRIIMAEIRDLNKEKTAKQKN